MSPVLIRPLEKKDIPACAAIMADISLWQRYGVTYQSAEVRLAQGFENRATIAVAEIDSRVTGFAWYVEKGAFARSGYVMLIGIHPDFQSEGIGKKLMDHVEEKVKQTSKDLFLLVSDFNLAAQRFYQRLGYQKVGELPGYVLPEISELIYRKRL